MSVNPKSLNNLVPGGNRKNAIRVTLTLKPKTVALLKAQGNMSEAVDKLIELCCQGYVMHDGSLNPIARSEPEKLESQDTHSSTDAIALSDQPPKPEYWTQMLTRSDIIGRGLSAYKLDNMPYDSAIRDTAGRLWWKVSIDRGNENLRPLGSKASTVWCR